MNSRRPRSVRTRAVAIAAAGLLTSLALGTAGATATAGAVPVKHRAAPPVKHHGHVRVKHHASTRRGPVVQLSTRRRKDTTPPVVRLTAPLAGSTVAGTVGVSASASDNLGVARVVFSLDGTSTKTLTSGPYAYSWDSTAVANGAHSLQARAYDAAGNRAVEQMTVLQ